MEIENLFGVSDSSDSFYFDLIAIFVLQIISLLCFTDFLPLIIDIERMLGGDLDI